MWPFNKLNTNIYQENINFDFEKVSTNHHFCFGTWISPLFLHSINWYFLPSLFVLWLISMAHQTVLGIFCLEISELRSLSIYLFCVIVSKTFLYILIGYQVFQSNTNNLHTVVWFQVFLTNTNHYIVSSDYSYLIIYICLHMVLSK